jgi:COP9 signalosome complex subunit 2
MTDQEEDDAIYFESDPDDVAVEAGEEAEAIPYEEEEQVPPDFSTPDGQYRFAKDQLSGPELDESTVGTAFSHLYGVLDSPHTEPALRAKALRRICIINARMQKLQDLLDSLDRVFAGSAEEWLLPAQVRTILNRVRREVIRSDDLLSEFLSKVTENVDRVQLLDVFLDLKLYQAELALQGGDFHDVSEFVNQVAPYCPIPPDRTSLELCRSAIRILVLQIEVADNDVRLGRAEDAEQRMFQYFELASQIPPTTLQPRQQAVLMRVEGLKCMSEGSYRRARALFWDAFKIFNELGIEKQVHCLQYCGMAAMLLRESISVFHAQEALPIASHPLTAPIAQLTNAYLAHDIVEFNRLRELVRHSFGDRPLYNEMLNQIRLFVLARAIIKFTRPFVRVQIAFMANRLTSNEAEVRQIVSDLILKRELNALFEASTEAIVMREPRVQSQYVLKLSVLVDALDESIRELTKAILG